MNYRVLIVPVVTSSANCLGDSGFYIAWECALELVEKGHHVYLLVPENMAKDVAVLQRPGVTVLVGCVPSEYYAAHHGILDTRSVYQSVSPAGGIYKIDAALCFSGEHALALRSCLGTYDRRRPIPIYTFDLGMDFFDSNPGFLDDEAKHRGQVMGYAASNPMMCTRRELSMLDDKAKHYGLGADLRRGIQERASIATPRVDLSRLAKFPRKNDGPFTLLYAARFNGVKRVEKILKAFDDIYRMGEDVRVEVMTNTPEYKADLFAIRRGLFKERGYLKPTLGASRDQFYEAASRSHVYVMWSTSEGYPMSLLEATYLGCIPMVHVDTWSRVVFSDWEDDLFWFRDEKELKTRILWVKSHWEEAQQRAQPLKALYEADERERRLGKVLLERLDDFYFVEDPPLWSGFEEPVSKLVLDLMMRARDRKAPVRAPLSMMIRAVDKYTRVGVARPDLMRWSSHRVITDWMLYVVMKHWFGLRDLTEGSEVVFEVPGDDEQLWNLVKEGVDDGQEAVKQAAA